MQVFRFLTARRVVRAHPVPDALRWSPGAAASFMKEQVMSVAKIIEVTAASPKSVEDAVRSGLKKVAETVKNIKGAWVNETKVVTDGDGNVVEWRVTLKITFLVE